MAVPGRSQRLIAQSRRARWGAVSTDDEARASFQARLALFSKLMFWSILALLAFLWLMYTVYPTVRPHQNEVIFASAIAGIGMMTFIWRLLLIRKTLTLDQLYLVDAIYSFGIGAFFGASAVLASDLRPAGYTTLLYAAYTVFMRAIVVPSSSRRTALMSILTMLPIWAAAIMLGITTTQELPSAAFILGSWVLSLVPILLATVGSDIIYGLRQQVSEAMQLGQYTLERKIGEGGNGAVYRAHHALLRRPTAIKLLLPDKVGADNLARFEREVQLMSQLTHANTVAVFDYGHNIDGIFYYAMEYLDGINLDQLVKQHGPQPSGRVVQILTQVCGALAEAHAQKLIHRDIKPANIILCERGGVPDVAKVVDFGLVKEITRDATVSTQVIMGTPAYVAPEAVTDPDHITHAVDLYALGAVGYYLLTGRPLFEGKTLVDVCIQHVTKEPTLPSQIARSRIAPELEAVIMKCLAKQPAERFASASALADALQAIPDPGDWSRADAVRWWADFRATAASRLAASDEPTTTITVDIARARVKTT